MGERGSGLELTTGVVFNILLARAGAGGTITAERILLFLAADSQDL